MLRELDPPVLLFARARADGRWRHPRDLHAADVEAFLNHLVLDRRLSAASQNQAINALVFLYRQVLGNELAPDHLGPIDSQRAGRPVRVPTVLSVREVERILARIPFDSLHRLMAQVLYGCGLRIASNRRRSTARGMLDKPARRRSRCYAQQISIPWQTFFRCQFSVGPRQRGQPVRRADGAPGRCRAGEELAWR